VKSIRIEFTQDDMIRALIRVTAEDEGISLAGKYNLELANKDDAASSSPLRPDTTFIMVLETKKEGLW